MELFIAESGSYNPYINLSIEWELMENCGSNEIFLFLWQNEKTVVIGANQNPYLECDIEKIYSDGGKIARRRTGGGAVYHDLGNLNFSFVANQENYDVDKQFSVIIHGLKNIGIDCVKSGRNDIETCGKKISGNAFYKTRKNCLHHGTLLINADIALAQKYLYTKKGKLASKGVQSVKSRIANLSEIKADIDVQTIRKTLKNSFEKIYGREIKKITLSENTKIKKEAEKIESEKYLFGKWKNFHTNTKGKFEWGNADIGMEIDDGIIKEIAVSSDCLQTKSIIKAENLLKGKKISEINYLNNKDKIVLDIINLLRNDNV